MVPIRRPDPAPLVILTLLAALAGCRSLPPAAGANMPWPERCAALTARSQYSFTGRVAARSNGTGFSAAIAWQQHGGDSQATLRGPLGVGTVHVTLNAEGVVVESAAGQRLGGSDGATALRELLGFEPPLAELRYWLLACSAPGPAAVETQDERLRLATLSQSEWLLEYTEYQDSTAPVLPLRLRAHRGADSLQLVIQHWQLQ